MFAKKCIPFHKFTLLFTILLAISCGKKAETPVAPNSRTEPSVAASGMVSTAHPLATRAGLDVLMKGGNAFDAAIAIAAMLNVVEPMMSGVGGYGTIILYNAETGESHFLNCSGRIPASVDSDVYRRPNPNYLINRHGAKAVSTPGNLSAWISMHERLGSMSWERLFQSAIETARHGFPISERIAGYIGRAYDNFPRHAMEFYGKEGRPLKTGETLIQRDLAGTLEIIAKEGGESFSSGRLAQSIDNAMKAAGGFLSLEDLQNNEAEWWQPITITYREYQVLTASPPATAFPSLIRLGMMSQFDNRTLGHNSAGYLHRFSEVTKHAFWCRLRYAGSPEINPPPLDKLLSEEYWADQVERIDSGKASAFVPPVQFSDGDMHTTHFVVADRKGNIVSMTQTLGNLFGSRIMPEGTGIWLNNSLAYCTFEPKGNPMDAHAGRHKLSGDCPTLIMRNGKPWAALGTPGGHTIGQTVPQMVINLIDFDMDIQKAIAAPRISFVEPDIIAVEHDIPASVRDELASMGHHIRTTARLGNAHGLMIEYDAEGNPVRFFGGADPRGEGTAQGLNQD